MTDVQTHLARLAQEPADAAALRSVEAFFSSAGRWEELLRVYEDSALRSEKRAAAPLLHKAALICLNELASPPRAENYLRRALDAAPTDLASLQSLRQLYLKRNDFEKAAEVYERELARTNDPKTKVNGLLQLAEIYSGKLRRFEKALASLKAAQRADKNHCGVLARQAEIYLTQGALEAAQQVLAAELQITAAGPAAADVLARLGKVAVQLVDHPQLHGRAREAIATVLQAAADEPNAQQAQRELAQYETHWQQKIVALEAAASRNPAGEESARLWLSIAEIQLVYGKNPAQALTSIDRALSAQPGQAAALRLLEEVYQQQGRHNDLAMKLEMMAAYSREPVLALELYLKAAVLQAVHVGNAEAAARVYNRVLQLDPGNKQASNALAEFYSVRREWPKALQVLEGWAQRTTVAADKVAAHLACARILTEEQKEPAAARLHYEAVLQHDPDNAAAAAVLEDVYRQSQDHAALARVLRAKLSHLQDEARLTVLRELGTLVAGPLNDAAAALQVYGELYQAGPSMEGLQQVQDLAAKSGQFESLAPIIEGSLERLPDNTARVAALHSLATIYEGARDAPLEALRVFRHIVALAPDDGKARDALQRLLERVGQSEEKVAFYRERIAAAQNSAEKVGFLQRLAAELESNAKDYVQAIDVYHEIFKLAPDDMQAVDSVLALYHRDHRWAETVDALALKLQRLPDQQRGPVLLEMADILEKQLQHDDGAVDCYLQMLAVTPQDATALAALERLLPRARKVVQIAERLLPGMLAAGRWEAAASMLEARIQRTQQIDQRVPLLQELSALYTDRLKQPAEGLNALMRAFQLDPARSELRQGLLQAGEAASDKTAILRALRAGSSALEGAERAKLRFAAGQLSAKNAQDATAVADFVSALGVDDMLDQHALGMIEKLRQQGRIEPPKLIDVAQHSTAGLESAQAIRVWRHVARLCDQMKSPQEEIAAWKAVLAEKPGDPEAVAELDKLMLASPDLTEVVAHLQVKMETTADDAVRLSAGLQLADILVDKLQDVPGALQHLNALAEKLPGERSLWQRISALHKQQGQVHEAATAMQREINLIGEGNERRTRLLEYAEICGKQLGDVGAAVSALQGVLTADPKNKPAMALLEELQNGTSDPDVLNMLMSAYRSAENWQPLVNLLQQQLDTLPDAAARINSLRELATLKATKLNDASGAYADLERAFQENPQDTGLRLDLERAAEAGQRWAQLAEAYASSLSTLGDSEAGRSVRRKLAEVLDKRLNRAAEAVEHYRALAGGALPDDLPSLEAMERLLRSDNRPQELAEVLAAMLPRLPPEQVDRKKQMYLELGGLAADQLSDKARAIDAYRSLVELDPKHVEGLRRLSKLLEDLGQVQDLVAVLDRLIELGPANTNLLEDMLRRATSMVQQNNVDEAFKSYRAVLLKKREHPQAVEGIEQLADSIDNKSELAQVLEPIYTARQDHAKLAWILEKKLDATTELVGRKALLRRIGDIFENRLQQKDRAFVMARRSLGEDPADMGVRMWIEKLAGETGALRELADAYVEEGQKSQPPLNVQFFRRAAALFHEKLTDLPSAVRQYQAILGIEQRDEKALSGLETIFRASEDFNELVEVLKRRLAVTAGLERKRDILNEIATLQAERMGDYGAAVGTCRELLKLTPDDPAPFAKIEGWLAQSSSFEDLDKLYQEEITRLAEKRGRDVVTRRLELTYRRGRLLDEQFSDREQAAQVFEAVLAEEATHANTIAYLEERAAAGQGEAIVLLEKVYRGQKAWPRFIELMEQKLTQTAESHMRRGIYLQISEVYDTEIKQGDQAFMGVARAFNENRGDPELLQRLEALAQKWNLWEELVDVLSVDLDALPEFKLRQQLLLRLGDICGNQLGKTNEAIGHLKTALQYDPGDEQALSALDALLEKNEMWAALADILERRIEVAVGPAQKSVLLERLAGVWGDKLMDAEAALRCHKQILDIDPDHPITLKSMQKLYAEVQDWDSLAANLQRQADVLKDPAEQVRIWAAAGTLYAEELSDNVQAAAAWLKVVEIDSSHEEANQALQILLTAEERWEDLATLYKRLLTHTQDPADKLDINRRLGVILGEKLGRSEDALLSWQKVLEQDPKNTDALRSLMALHTERAMWQEFVGLARRLIALVDPVEAKDVRFALAKALGENLGQRDDAIRLAREVRATEPHTVDQLVRLGDMLCNIQAWDEAVIALDKGAALDQDPTAKVGRYYQVATVFRDKLNKPNEARNAYEAILATTPADLEAYTALAQIYRNTNEWRKLVALNEEFVLQASPELKLAMLVEIRDTQDVKLGEKDMAFLAGCRVYKENPNDLAAAEILERIALESGLGEDLAGVLEDEVDHIVDPSVKIASLRRIARLYANAIKDVNSAETTLNRILQIQPDDMEALDELARLGEKEERFDKQIAVLERKLQELKEDTDRKAILFEIARIWEDKIGEVDEGIAALQRILQIDGVDTQALDSLARVYQQNSRWTELAHTLTRKVELTQDAAQNVALRMQVAGLCENELKDTEAAIQWYRGVLDFDPSNAQALSSLERLYTGFERWSELISVFETQISLSQETEEKLRLLTKIAVIYENEFNSLKDAVACFERCFELDKKHIASIKSLERILRAMGEWNRLIEVLQHHVTLVQESNQVTELYLEIGEVYYKELSRVDKAEQIYNAAREINPKSTAALHALGKLYERSGNWFQSLEMLQREADILGSNEGALPVLTRIGKINEDMLMDREAAKGAYQRALSIDSTYAPALEALKEIARSSEDWENYAEHLITEAETADDPEQKTELFMEAAKFFQQIREDEANAIRFYQRALSITADHYDSARSLADIYFRNEMWEEARDLYLIVIKSLDKTADPKDFCQKFYRLGYISEKMGAPEQALAYYKQAFDADATYLPALEGLGQALLRAEQWEEAQKVFQTVLIHHRESLTESEVVDVQWQLGDICLKQNQPDRAYKQFEKALEVDPDHAPSLRNLSQLDAQIGNWEQAYARMSRFADTAPGPERVPVLLEMSQIARDKLADDAKVIEPLERARRLGNPPLDLLETLGMAYLKGGHGTKAVEALEQAAALASDPPKRSELSFTLGTIYEQHLKHEPMAVQKYNDALDAAPTNIKAFERVERILGQRQEWALLEANYRAMIARAKDLSPQIRVVLWRSLGELYRQVLRNVDSAIMAYEVLQKLDPGKPQYTAVLAELYAAKPDNRPKAIEMQHDLLATVDNPVAPVRTLRKLYHANRDFDAVFVLCNALVFLKEADEEERKLVEYLARGVPPRASRGLSEDYWKLVLDPVVNEPIGTLAALLYRTAPDAVTVPAKDLGLKKKDQLDVRQSELYFANMVRYVAGALTLPPVDVFRKSGSMEPLHLVNSQPPSLVAGESNEIFRDSQQRVTLYHIARNMAYARPELFLGRVYPGAELRDLLLGLCLVYNRTLQHNGDPREVDKWASQLERLPDPSLKRLKPLAQAAYPDLIKGTPLAAYGAAVEKTVARVGLIAAGDLAACAKGVTEGGEGASPMPVRDRIRELVLFAVSRQFLQIRKLMGAALAEGKAAG